MSRLSSVSSSPAVSTGLLSSGRRRLEPRDALSGVFVPGDCSIAPHHQIHPSAAAVVVVLVPYAYAAHLLVVVVAVIKRLFVYHSNFARCARCYLL